MLSKLLLAWVVVAACVLMHAASVTSAMRWVRRHPTTSERFWLWIWLFVRLAGWIIVVHLAEIAAWALLYAWRGAMTDLASALYFSAVTYTTTGYGDLVLPAEWRLVGGIEALTGILMCGWSTGFFFAIVSRMIDRIPTANPPERESYCRGYVSCGCARAASQSRIRGVTNSGSSACGPWPAPGTTSSVSSLSTQRQRSFRPLTTSGTSSRP